MAERGDLLSSLLKMEVDAVEGPQVGEGAAQGGILGCQPPSSSSWCVRGLHWFRLYQPLSSPAPRGSGCREAEAGLLVSGARAQGSSD